MSYEENNRGAIWKNESKTEDKHPDFRGHSMVEGVEYWVSAWKRTSENPKAPALSFKFESKAEAMEKGKQKVMQVLSETEKDDDIPF